MSPSPPIHLQTHFLKGRRFLVVAGSQVWLAEKSAQFWPAQGRRRVPGIVIDLPQLWDRFAELAGERIEFSKADLGKCAGCSPEMIERFQQAGWLPDGAGPFSLCEAFTSALIGSLVRHGATALCISKASVFVRIGEPQCAGVSR